MSRPLEQAKVIQTILKNGVKLLGKHPSQARQASLKKIILKMEGEGFPTSEAEDFSRCMRFLKEFGAGDALGSHSVSLEGTP